MKRFYSLTLILLISILVNRTALSQVNNDDLTSWGLKILSGELSKSGKGGASDAVYGLSKLFETSSNRRYQKDLANIMYTLNLPNGIYAINGGNIVTVPNGYIKQEGEWISLNDITDGELTMIYGGNLLSIPTNWLLFKKSNEWQYLDIDKIASNEIWLYNNDEMQKLNDGWYRQNGEWKHISKLINKEPANRYSFQTKEPYGLYCYHSWTDTNNDRIIDKIELAGLNKDVYNIAKEYLIMGFNIPEVSDNVVFTSWKGNKLIGTTVINFKTRGTHHAKQIGPTGDPTTDMDYMDRILLDVRKNGSGLYKIIATNTNKEFETFEKTIKVIYQP